MSLGDNRIEELGFVYPDFHPGTRPGDRADGEGGRRPWRERRCRSAVHYLADHVRRRRDPRLWDGSQAEGIGPLVISLVEHGCLA